MPFSPGSAHLRVSARVIISTPSENCHNREARITFLVLKVVITFLLNFETVTAQLLCIKTTPVFITKHKKKYSGIYV